jgi:hypothetical protein
VSDRVDRYSRFPRHSGADPLDLMLHPGVFLDLLHDRADCPATRDESAALLEILAAKFLHLILLVSDITD